MNILVVNTLYFPEFQGGAERSVQLLCEEFYRKGNNVTVVSIGLKEREHIENGVRVINLKTKNIVSYLKVKKKILPIRLVWHIIDTFNLAYYFFFKGLINSVYPDILFTHNLSGFSVSVWLFAKLKGIPIVHVLRDHGLMCPRSTMYNNGKRCKKQCLKCYFFSLPKRQASHFVTGVIGISKYILNRHLNNGYFKNSILSSSIPNSVKLEFKDSFDRGERNNIVFGYFGRLSQEKGVEFLIEEFNNISNLYKCKLIIGGNGDVDYVNWLKNKSKDSNIEFLGYVNPPDFYSRIDYLVVPSLLEETFGRVVIEAWQYGIFVLGSLGGGVSELEQYGNLKVFIPEKDQLTRKMIDCLNGTYRFDVNEYFRHMKMFDKEIVADEYLSVFKEILTKRGKLIEKD